MLFKERKWIQRNVHSPTLSSVPITLQCVNVISGFFQEKNKNWYPQPKQVLIIPPKSKSPVPKWWIITGYKNSNSKSQMCLITIYHTIVKQAENETFFKLIFPPGLYHCVITVYRAIVLTVMRSQPSLATKRQILCLAVQNTSKMYITCHILYKFGKCKPPPEVQIVLKC